MSTKRRKRLFLGHPFTVLALVGWGMVNLFRFHRGMPAYYDFIFLGSALTALYLEALLVADVYNFAYFKRNVEMPTGHSEGLAKLRVPYRIGGGLFAMLTFASGILLLAAMSPYWALALEATGLFLTIVGMGMAAVVMGLLLGVVCITGKNRFWFLRKSKGRLQ